MSITQTIFARNTVSMTDLRRNPSEVIEAATYEDMLDQLEDAALTKIVKARNGGKTVRVKLEDLSP